MKGNLKCYYWSRIPNFGDKLVMPVIQGILGNDVKLSLASIGDTGKLVSIGTSADAIREGDVVYGTGADKRIDLSWEPVTAAEYVCVRGPMTRELLATKGIQVPERYLDPARLLPRFHDYPVNPSGKIMLIPNYRDVGAAIALRGVEDDSAYRFGSVLTGWGPLTDEIRAAKLVISSALHPIIVAEAYGVPAVWVNDGRGAFKFEDYYASTGRTVTPLPWGEALKADPPPLPAPVANDYVAELREVLSRTLLPTN